MVKGKFPHIEWLDLAGNNVLIECAIMKTEDTGGKMFIRLDQLDTIDKQRIAKILTNRNANAFELWDLMAQITLGNGENALKYFHQMVKVFTPDGTVMKPKTGQMGIAAPTAQTKAE